MTMALGIRASLQQNLKQRRAIRKLDAAVSHPLYPILFDPQTAGGLLASVPVQRAQACVMGYGSAAIAGFVEPRSGSLAGMAVELEEAWHGSETSSGFPNQSPQNQSEEMSRAHQPVL